LPNFNATASVLGHNGMGAWIRPDNMKSVLLSLVLFVPQDVESLIRRLKDESPGVREEATKALRTMGEDALPALKGAAEDVDAEARARVTALIRHLEWDPTMDPALLARYEGLRFAFSAGEHRGVIQIAKNRNFGISGYQGDFEAYAIRALDSLDIGIRKEALGLLGAGHYGIPRRPISPLVREISRWDAQRCEDSGGYWLSCLAEKVYSLASPLDQKLLAETRATDAEAEEILEVLRARHGVPGAEKAIPKLLESKSERVVWLALRCVKDRRVAAARPQLLQRLARSESVDSMVDVVIAIEDDACRRAYRELWQSTPPEKRTAGLVTLVARSGAPDVSRILLELLDKGPASLQYAVAAAVAELRTHEAVDRLLSPSAPAELRSHYVQAAARIVDSSDVGKLVELLGASEEGVRNNVRCLLYNLPDQGAMRTLLGLLIHESRPIFRDRLFDVVKCGDLYLPGLLDGVPDQVLETIVKGGEPSAAHNSAEILLKRKGKAAVAILEDALLASGEDRAYLLQLLLDSPSERVATAAVSWLKGSWAHYVIAYLEKAKAPGTVPALERTSESHADPTVKRAAADALGRLRGDPAPKEVWFLDSYPWIPFIEPVALDAPGAREELRKKVKAEGVSTYLKALQVWAHPEMIPALMDGLRSWDGGLAERVSREGYPGSCLVTGHEIYGSDWMWALAATQDRSLDSFFVERLADPDPGVRGVAIRTAGRWKILKADPLLRRLVRSASYEVRAEALEALANIAAPGTKDFIVEQLRDNPHAAPLALARLGAVDAIPAIARLLEDPGPKAAVLSALDLLSNPQVYDGIDKALPRFRLGQQRDLVQLLQETLKVPVRVTLPHPPNLSMSSDSTYRGALESLAGMHRYYYSDLKVTHVFRNGAVEFCSVDDAQAYWTKRLAR